MLEVVVQGGPAVPGLEASVRNLVPLLRYAAPRANGITSFFANMASATAHGDSDGAWARFAILFEPGELTDVPTPASCAPEDDAPHNTGRCHNAYPSPGDALDPSRIGRAPIRGWNRLSRRPRSRWVIPRLHARG